MNLLRCSSAREQGVRERTKDEEQLEIEVEKRRAFGRPVGDAPFAGGRGNHGTGGL